MFDSCLSRLIAPLQTRLGLLRARNRTCEAARPRPFNAHELTFPTKASAEEFLAWLDMHGCASRTVSLKAQGWIVTYCR